MTKTLYEVVGEPWFPLLYKRWLKDTARLTLEQQGAYLRLIIAQVDSDEGELANEDAFLCGASGCPPARFEEVVRPLLKAPFFHRRAGSWVNARALWCWSRKTQRSRRARELAKLKWGKEKREILSLEPMRCADAEPAVGSCGAQMQEKEKEKEKEKKKETRPPRGGVAVADLPVQQAAVAVWEECMGAIATKGANGRYAGGMDPRRIVQAVLPLIVKHGRDETLAIFRRYLSTREPQFCTPEDFATRYIAWSQNRGVKPVPL